MSNSSASLWTLTAAQLRDQIASTDPTPGGGSVSIITAALGAASIQKAVAVSLKKSAVDSPRHQSLLNLSYRVSALLASLSELADADSLAFQRYLKACAQPRTNENEKARRRAARKDCLVRATEVPLEAAAEMARGLEFAEAAAGIVDIHVRSEILAGRVLLQASIESVLLNVDANLPGISDETIRNALKLRRKKVEHVAKFPATGSR